MFFNQLKITFRYALKHKAFSLLTVFGLALGLACTAGIYLWVSHELSFNLFHKKSNQIFQVTLLLDGWESSVVTPAPLAASLKNEYAEVLNATRYSYRSEGTLLTVDEKRFIEKGAETDPSFFEIFDFKFKQGDAKNFNNNKIILTETTAKKYFGNKDPLGAFISLNNEENYIVSAVLQNLPENSSFQFDFIIPFKSIQENDLSKAWGAWFCATFVELHEGVDPKEFLVKTSGFKTFYDKINKTKWSSELIALPDLYFHEMMTPFFPHSGDIKYIWIFSIAGFLIFLLTSLNYLSLSTSRFTSHLKQNGLERILGANSRHTISKYFVEATLYAFFAFVLASISVLYFKANFISNDQEVFSSNYFFKTISIMIIITSIMIFLATVIPVVLFKSAHPIALLKKTSHLNPAGFSLRKLLVIFQFSVSISMVISILIFREQLNFIQQKDLGYEKENLISIKLNENTSRNVEVLKNDLLQHSNIVDASRSTFEYIYFDTQISEWEGNDREGSVTVRPMTADSNFVKTFNIKVVEGRFYESGYPDEHSVVINQEAVKKMGLKLPIGKKVKLPWDDAEKEIIGVVNDFNYWGLTNPIEPVFIFNGNSGNLYVKINEVNSIKTLEFIEATFRRLNPDYPMEFVFLAERFNHQHAAHHNTGKIFSFFGIITIIMSCFSLLAMVIFNTEQKTKEIGVRKVNGASISHIVQLLTKDLMGYVLIGFIVAFPFTWFAMNKWLQIFSDRISLSAWFFLAGGFLTLLVAFLTIIYHALKAAYINPIHALKEE